MAATASVLGVLLKSKSVAVSDSSYFIAKYLMEYGYSSIPEVLN